MLVVDVIGQVCPVMGQALDVLQKFATEAAKEKYLQPLTADGAHVSTGRRITRSPVS
jgi:hypothetical protein